MYTFVSIRLRFVNFGVYFTINALQNKIVNFPNITDLSLRQAVRRLENLGLVVGKLEYKSDRNFIEF